MNRENYLNEVEKRLNRLFTASKEGYKAAPAERHRLEGFMAAGVFMGLVTNAELAKVMVTYPQLLKNIPVKNKPPLEQVPVLHQRINEIELEIQGHGRLLVRYSGTENKLRVMMEGENIELITGHVDELAELVRQNLGQEEA